MSGPDRPSGGPPQRQQQRSLEPAGRGLGVTCPVCGLTNETGARVCRNCGLPIASSTDPLRGVAAGHVDIVKPRRNGISATLGLVLVVGLLIVSGTLAVSGGGILSGGGRIGVAPGATQTPSGEPGTDDQREPQTPTQPSTDGSSATPAPAAELVNRFDYTCDSAAMSDLSKRRWNISQFLVGARDGFDLVTFEMTRRGNKEDSGTVARIDWLDPARARSQFGISRVAGDKALVVTFDGPVTISANQKIDRLFLDPEGVQTVRSVEMFQGEDGLVHAVIGVRGDACAKMRAPQWKPKAKGRRAKAFLEIESPQTAA